MSNNFLFTTPSGDAVDDYNKELASALLGMANHAGLLPNDEDQLGIVATLSQIEREGLGNCADPSPNLHYAQEAAIDPPASQCQSVLFPNMVVTRTAAESSQAPSQSVLFPNMVVTRTAASAESSRAPSRLSLSLKRSREDSETDDETTNSVVAPVSRSARGGKNLKLLRPDFEIDVVAPVSSPARGGKSMWSSESEGDFEVNGGRTPTMLARATSPIRPESRSVTEAVQNVLEIRKNLDSEIVSANKGIAIARNKMKRLVGRIEECERSVKDMWRKHEKAKGECDRYVKHKMNCERKKMRLSEAINLD